MNLIIVESPTKARTLSRFLGKDYSVLATTGHIKDLPESKLSIDVDNNFKPDYQVVEKRLGTIKELKSGAMKAKNVYIATDPDREGEAIAEHVRELLMEEKARANIKRISFHEITKSAVEEAIAHPGEVNKDLVDAQIARRVLDRLVGYKLSPLLWKKVRRGLSAGRVQSVVVRLIVEKEREIDAFKKEEYWEIAVSVKQLNSSTEKQFSVQLVKINDKLAKIGNEKSAKEIVTELEKSNYKVLDVRRREVKKNPYPPFTTSTMTQAGARLFGWSAKKTMSTAQKLYEEGLITYHRTDSTNLSNHALDAVRDYIDKNYGEKYLPEKPRFFKVHSKNAQEAHEAIRPTDVNAKLQITNDKFKGSEEKLYNLIWKRFVACQMNPVVFDSTTIDVQAQPLTINHQPSTYLLRASGQTILFDGWRKVIPLSALEEPELPVVEKDESLDYVKVNSEQKFTQPPPRYNEASLIKTLEKLGIGRPSTYAPIITTIQTRAYVEKNEGKFVPTPVGVAVNDFLVKNFADIDEYGFTAEMEKELDDVAKGELDWTKMMGEFYKPFDKKLVDVEKNSERVKIEAEKTGRKCPTCEAEGRKGKKQGDLVIRTGRFGKFISCSLFPECKHTEKYINKIGVKCPKCKKGDVIMKNTRIGRKFFGCSKYPKCDFASWKKPGGKKKEEEKEEN